MKTTKKLLNALLTLSLVTGSMLVTAPEAEARKLRIKIGKVKVKIHLDKLGRTRDALLTLGKSRADEKKAKAEAAERVAAANKKAAEEKKQAEIKTLLDKQVIFNNIVSQQDIYLKDLKPAIKLQEMILASAKLELAQRTVAQEYALRLRDLFQDQTEVFNFFAETVTDMSPDMVANDDLDTQAASAGQYSIKAIETLMIVAEHRNQTMEEMINQTLKFGKKVEIEQLVSTITELRTVLISLFEKVAADRENNFNQAKNIKSILKNKYGQ